MRYRGLLATTTTFATNWGRSPHVGSDAVTRPTESSSTLASLAGLLIGDPHTNLIEAFIDDLTGASLQSREQLIKVTKALGVANETLIKTAIENLTDTFDVRNKIAYEMDINFATVNRNRTSRARDNMVRRTNSVLATGDALLRSVDTALAACPAG